MVSEQLLHELRDIPPGEPVEVLTDRQGVVEYLMTWCRESGTRVVSIDTIDGDIRVVVRRPTGEAQKRRPGDQTGAFRSL